MSRNGHCEVRRLKTDDSNFSWEKCKVIRKCEQEEFCDETSIYPSCETKPANIVLLLIIIIIILIIIIIIIINVNIHYSSWFI